MKKHQVPLDLAGQVVWIAWNLQEIQPALLEVLPILDKALALGGIREFKNLRYRKSKGQTVFGQVPSYPQGTANDTEALLKAIADYRAKLTPINIPQGDYVAAGPDWQPIETPAFELAIADTQYTAPLDLNAPS